MRWFWSLALLCLVLSPHTLWADSAKSEWQDKPDSYWQEKLSPQQYRVCRREGTERAYSGKYNDFKAKGRFLCSSCGYELFSSEQKYDSKTGWPSFWEPIAKTHITEHEDNKLWMKRTEIRCSRCGAHLGHIFPDGPPPTGQRYCVNSVCLDFVPDP